MNLNDLFIMEITQVITQVLDISFTTVDPLGLIFSLITCRPVWYKCKQNGLASAHMSLL